MNQNRDAGKLSIRVAEFKKNEGKRRNEEERVEGRSSCYKLNITNEFIDAFNRRI